MKILTYHFREDQLELKSITFLSFFHCYNKLIVHLWCGVNCIHNCYSVIQLTYLLFLFPRSPLTMRASSSSWPLTWRMTSPKSCVSTSSPPSKARLEAVLPISLVQEQAYWVGCYYSIFATPHKVIIHVSAFCWCHCLMKHSNDPVYIY